MKPFFGREVIESPRRGSTNRRAKARKFGRIVPDEETGYEYYGETKIPSFMGGRRGALPQETRRQIFLRCPRPAKGLPAQKLWPSLERSLFRVDRGVGPLRLAIEPYPDTARRCSR